MHSAMTLTVLPNRRLASDTRCTAADINPGGHAAEKVGDDVFLTEAEKLEVLRVWEDKVNLTARLHCILKALVPTVKQHVF